MNGVRWIGFLIFMTGSFNLIVGMDQHNPVSAAIGVACISLVLIGIATGRYDRSANL